MSNGSNGLARRAKELRAGGITTLYIAGRMSNQPGHGFSRFHTAAKELRRLGFTVISPAELPDELTAREKDAIVPGDETWAWLLRRDLQLITAEVDGIAVLPGWSKSRGAKLETFTAASVRIPILYASSLEPVRRGRIAAPPVLAAA